MIKKLDAFMSISICNIESLSVSEEFLKFFITFKNLFIKIFCNSCVVFIFEVCLSIIIFIFLISSIEFFLLNSLSKKIANSLIYIEFFNITVYFEIINIKYKIVTVFSELTSILILCFLEHKSLTSLESNMLILF